MLILLNVQKHSQFIIYEWSGNQVKIEFPYFKTIFSINTNSLYDFEYLLQWKITIWFWSVFC